MLNKFVEIKTEYLKRFGYITYSYKEGYTDEIQTCLERWVDELNKIEPQNQYSEYTEILSCLELNQHENFLLLRYGRYSNIYDGETENSGEDLWERYDGFYRECRSVVIDVVNDYIVLDTCFLINYHMMHFNWNTDKANEKWKKIFGEYKYQMFLDFNKCDKAR